MASSTFDQLVNEALAQNFSGWDFSWTRDRWHEEPPPWRYRDLVSDRAASATSLLDMGTGGGEFLASLPYRPASTTATESYPPNIPVARVRLEPLGIAVVAFTDDRMLPLPDAAFDLVINRHESYWPAELNRILQPGGTFLTQQVGPLDCIEINQFLNAPIDPDAETWTLKEEIEPLAQAGLNVIQVETARSPSLFHDIGAVVFYLKIISWQIPGFTVETYRERLLALHEHIEREGAFIARSHRFLIEARKP